MESAVAIERTWIHGINIEELSESKDRYKYLSFANKWLRWLADCNYGRKRNDIHIRDYSVVAITDAADFENKRPPVDQSTPTTVLRFQSNEHWRKTAPHATPLGQLEARKRHVAQPFPRREELVDAQVAVHVLPEEPLARSS